MDCCDLGKEDTTYICDVPNQQYCKAWLGRPRTHIDNIELQIGSDYNNSQSWECKRPIRGTRALYRNEEE